jgi:AraC-like DNA-binding protein
MDVVALLPPPLLAHLKRVLERAEADREPHAVVGAADWGDLGRRLRREPADVLVVDPVADGRSRVPELAAIVEQQPALPVVVYTTFSPSAARALVELAKHGVHQVVFHRFDDEPGRLRELIEQQPGMKLGDEVLRRLAVPLARLPVPVQRAVERLFRHPREFEAGDLAASAGVPVRTLYRMLESAGLASPALVVRGARLLRAYSLLRGGRTTAEDVASKLRYSSRQLFAKHVRGAFGATVAELRRSVGPEELVERLTELVYPSGGAGGALGEDEDPILPDAAPDEEPDEEPDMNARER